jgi:FtsZ-interacting cell division protein ZipA
MTSQALTIIIIVTAVIIVVILFWKNNRDRNKLFKPESSDPVEEVHHDKTERRDID